MKKPTRKPVAAKSAYFVNAPVDTICIGGLSLLSLVGFWLVSGKQLSLAAAQWSVFLSWAINWPHFSATTFRLFRRSENFRSYPLTTLLLPLLVGGAVVASLWQPAIIAPFFIKLFLIWSPYHFSGQNIGISLVYARRNGFEIENWERKILTYFIFATFLVPTLGAEVGIGSPAPYYEIAFPTLNLPLWVGSVSRQALYFLGAAVIAMVGWRAVKAKPLFPPMVLLPAITQLCWFTLGPSVPSFYYFVPMFHSLQYLLIAGAVYVTERQAESKRMDPAFTWGAFGGWAMINVCGGAVLFWGLPHFVAWRGVPLALATGVLIAGVQIHHFLVDGVIWKLRNPKVAAPLMSSVRMRVAA